LRSPKLIEPLQIALAISRSPTWIEPAEPGAGQRGTGVGSHLARCQRHTLLGSVSISALVATGLAHRNFFTPAAQLRELETTASS
jgi:hypothetical protein